MQVSLTTLSGSCRRATTGNEPCSTRTRKNACRDHVQNGRGETLLLGHKGGILTKAPWSHQSGTTRFRLPFVMSPPAELLMLGDYLGDIQAGRAAGTLTALVTHGRDLPFAREAEFTLDSFEQIPALLWNWFCE